jgi:octanoyl-[GcvH]:protein N-octanoyltransferase
VTSLNSPRSVGPGGSPAPGGVAEPVESGGVAGRGESGGVAELGESGGLARPGEPCGVAGPGESGGVARPGEPCGVAGPGESGGVARPGEPGGPGGPGGFSGDGPAAVVLREPIGDGPEWDAALGPLLLRHGLGGAVDILRVHSPAPTAAFSRRDTLRPGYARAAEVVAQGGFVPVIRPQGGSLAAYGPGSVVIDHVHRSGASPPDPGPRFRHFALMHAAVLKGLGVPVQIGPVPHEYCPGEYSLNAAGAKIVGSAQRVTRDGWLFSTVIQVTGASGLRPVLIPAYRELGHDFDPGTVGALEDTVPGLTVPVVTAAVLAAYGFSGPPARLPSSWPDDHRKPPS